VFNEVLPRWGVYSGTVRVDVCDGHTGVDWKADAISTDAKSVTITKGGDRIVWVIGSMAANKEEKDRIKLSWNATANALGVIDYNVLVISNSAMTYLDKSSYAAHFVTGKQWIDFADLAAAGYKLTASKVNATAYSVRVFQDKLAPGKVYLQDPATGGLNCAQATRGYSVVNYTTTVALYEAGTHIAGDTQNLTAYYNYTNTTFIDGATCTYTLDPPAGGNLTGAMNLIPGLMYNYSFEPTMNGAWDAYVTCNATDHDSHTAHTSWALTGQPTTLDVYSPATSTYSYGDDIWVFAYYNYTNGTYIDAATCNATLQLPSGNNTQNLVDLGNHYAIGFVPLELGDGMWSVECAANSAQFRTDNGLFTVYPLNTTMTTSITGVFSTGGTIQFLANYTYLNTTYIPAATCNVTVLDPTFVNTTYVMNDLTNQYNYSGTFTLVGNYAYEIDCGLTTLVQNQRRSSVFVIIAELPTFDVWSGIIPQTTCSNSTHLRKTWSTTFSGVDYSKTSLEKCDYGCIGNACTRSLIREADYWFIYLVLFGAAMSALWIARGVMIRI